jgi:hypothetical protein
MWLIGLGTEKELHMQRRSAGRGRAKLAAAVGVTLVGLWGAQARGQQAPSNAPPDDAGWRQRMELRMDSLERENAELRKEVTRVSETKQAVMDDAVHRGETFTLTTRPVQTTPDTFDVHKYVAEGNFPGSIVIPGTNISLQVGGFVQLDAIADTNRIGSQDSFVVSSIPTTGDAAGGTNFSVRQTRVFLRTETPTEIGPLITHVEGDFFGPDGTDFRLRHAYGQIGEKSVLLAGQTWTTFMDASVYPAIFDYQGPNGMVNIRTPLVRFTENFTKQLSWSIALEDPNPDLSTETTTAGESTSLWPDLASNIRWSPRWGHLQLAGMVRNLTFDPDEGPRSSEIGWGVNFTGGINLFQELAKGKQDNLLFGILGGQGIENYISDTNGIGEDGFVDATGNLDALGVYGGHVAYQHFWSARWASTVGYSYLHVDTAEGQPGDAYESGHYGVANITYYPTDRLWMGLEVLYGVRNDNDGGSGDDGRVSFSVQYRF